ncbi:MAG: M23 family metallopeptidase [Alphaproteobacteria bacterium]|nr:M23 family metallopeptidase [Alphaproteobacteria bacterium]MBL7099840.1 M23 family metallopeptidase [Alphaproteobacteria bacterium]
MVRIFELQRVAALLATVLLSSVFLTGCVSDPPKTALDWFPQGDPPAHRVADNGPTPRPRPAHHHTHAAAPPTQAASADCPPGQNHPAWYTQNNPPPARPAAPQAATYTPDPSPGDAGATFVWPIQGRVIADFGATSSGGRNDGINIAAATGTPIHAAGAGQVSYAGNELRGYGNLVLIKHDGGYVTAYAHADRIVVNRGDYVARGQVIGYSGQTGDVTSPQLHFEIRKGITPVNPRTMLTTRTASAN